jgi:hypothetical protein
MFQMLTDSNHIRLDVFKTILANVVTSVVEMLRKKSRIVKFLEEITSLQLPCNLTLSYMVT